MSQQIWRNRAQITLPEEIRKCLEGSAVPSTELPAGAQLLLKELEKVTNSQTAVAWQQGPFKTAVVSDDEEEVKTRWNSQPTGWIVLLASRPVITGSEIRLTFRDGSTMLFWPEHFSFPLAKALQLHSIRVPLFYIKNLLDKEPSWLYRHLRNSLLAICPNDSLDCSPITSCQKAPYHFTYSSETGLRAIRNVDVTLDSISEDEGWF
jgi:hypothetical protein